MASDSKLDAVLAQRSVDDGDAVQQRLVGLIRSAIDARVEVQLVFIAARRNTGQQPGERHSASRVTAQYQREFFQRTRLDASLLYGRFVIERGCVGGNLDGFRRGAHLERNVNPHPLVEVHRNAPLDVFAETFCGNR